jgi:hypothetical protein
LTAAITGFSSPSDLIEQGLGAVGVVAAFFGAVAVHLADVGAGHKALALAGDDDAQHLRLGLDAAKDPIQLAQSLVVERVARFGTVHGDHDDGPVLLHLCIFQAFRQLLDCFAHG